MTLDTTFPPTLFNLDASEVVEWQRTPRARPAEVLPPPLFEAERRQVIRTPHGTPFVPWGDQPCGMCRKPMKRLPWTRGCGGADQDGHYVICDDCACDDLAPSGKSRWGLTHEYLEVERLRRRVYAAGGGETEVAAALEQQRTA